VSPEVSYRVAEDSNIGSIAWEDIVSYGNTLPRHHQPDDHLLPIRPFVSTISPLRQTWGALSLEVGAGGAEEHQIYVQVLPLFEKQSFLYCLDALLLD
jgi:hypothetical protein